MRIVGGSLSGRQLSGKPPAGTRPTPERVREALGSILASRGTFEGARVLDLFAGTGALAFESLSRGARNAVLIDKNRLCIESIREDAQRLGVADRVRPIVLDLLRSTTRVVEALASEPFTLVLADPPYDGAQRAVELLLALHSQHVFSDGATIVLEHGSRQAPVFPVAFEVVSRHRYGDTSLLIACVT